MRNLQSIVRVDVLVAVCLLSYAFSAQAQAHKVGSQNIGIKVLSVKTAQKSYPLTVRGGRGLSITTEKTSNKSFVKLVIKFNFSSRKAGNGLQPAQGAWKDRGGRDGEPARLEFTTSEDNAQNIYDNLQSSQTYYIFECYNTGKGYLQVTKAYKRPMRID